jgi:hypothetical protein
MSRRARFILSWAAAAASLVLVAGVAHATVVIAVPLAEQVQRSELVVRATVVAQQSAWAADRTTIYTWTELRVTDRIKGNAPSTLVLRQMGGVAEGIAMAVPGDGHLAVGEDVVLLLHQQGENVFLYSLAQSIFHVDGRTHLAARDLRDLAFATRVNGQMNLEEAPIEMPVPVDTLVRELRSYAARGAR